MKAGYESTHFIVSPTPLFIANRHLAHESLLSQASIGNRIIGVGGFSSCQASSFEYFGDLIND
jgi:hypothetical protein